MLRDLRMGGELLVVESATGLIRLLLGLYVINSGYPRSYKEIMGQNLVWLQQLQQSAKTWSRIRDMKATYDEHTEDAVSTLCLYSCHRNVCHSVGHTYVSHVFTFWIMFDSGILTFFPYSGLFLSEIMTMSGCLSSKADGITSADIRYMHAVCSLGLQASGCSNLVAAKCWI